MKACSVIDAPSDLGLRPTGVRGLPQALREAGLLEGLPDARYDGIVPVPAYSPRRRRTAVLNTEGIRAFSSTLAEHVEFALNQHRFPLVLGGDCSILLGIALALRRRGRFGLFFVDGHADFYSPESEPNGELASMELAAVTGGAPEELADLEGLRPLIREKDVVALGIRDLKEAEEYRSPDIRQSSIKLFDLDRVRESGARAAAAEGLALLEQSGVAGFWIHLDADVLNDEVMPAVDYRMPGGLWPEELVEILQVVLLSPLAVGMDVTIYNPSLDDQERAAARVLARSIAEGFAGPAG
jgi:arginase